MLWWILTNWSSRIWFIPSIWWQDLTLSLYHHSWLCAVRVLCAKCSSTRPHKRNIEINFRDTLTRLCNVSISFADRCNGVWRRLFPSHFVMQHNYHWLQSISREIGTEQFSSLSSETGAAPPPPPNPGSSFLLRAKTNHNTNQAKYWTSWDRFHSD